MCKNGAENAINMRPTKGVKIDNNFALLFKDHKPLGNPITRYYLQTKIPPVSAYVFQSIFFKSSSPKCSHFTIEGLPI